jgi:diguanylate cyclase (GGDEF)-like protein
MEIDLFEYEKNISAAAADLIRRVRAGAGLCVDDYAALAGEYDKMLEQLRRATHLSDRTATVLYKSNLDLADKVHHDALTGIYNRRYLEENLVRVISTLSRSGDGKLSVLMTDLDFFKNYNDTYGHNLGDACLKAVAKTLADCLLRPEDFVARYGGEEFVVVLPNTGKSGACDVADRILHNVRSLNIPHENSATACHVTLSVGITSGRALYTNNAADYIKKADQAMYLSKQNGRNRYTYLVFEEE